MECVSLKMQSPIFYFISTFFDNNAMQEQQPYPKFSTLEKSKSHIDYR